MVTKKEKGTKSKKKKKKKNKEKLEIIEQQADMSQYDSELEGESQCLNCGGVN